MAIKLYDPNYQMPAEGVKNYDFLKQQAEQHMVGFEDPTINKENIANYKARGFAEQTYAAPAVYADSSSVKAAENAIGYDINKSVSDVSTKSSDYQSFLDEQRKSLQTRRDVEIAGIKETAEATKAATEAAQLRETGTTAVGLARMGSYLGGTASATGVMQNLVESHRSELSSLDAKKNEAIRTAQGAYDDQDFKLAKAKMDEAKDLEKTIQDRKDKFLNQSIQLAQEARAKTQEARAEKTAGISEENIRIDNNRQAFQLLISSKAVGNLSDEELDKWSLDTKMSLESVEAVRDAVNEPNVKVEGNVSDGFVKITMGKDGVVKLEQLTAGTKGSEDEKKIIENVLDDISSISDIKAAGNREQFIRVLQVKYPNVDPGDISNYVYRAYPDGYDKSW